VSITYAFAKPEDAVDQHDRGHRAIEHGVLVAGVLRRGIAALHESTGEEVAADGGGEDVESVGQVDGRADEQLSQVQGA
jgi:hypothetical protein